jgi:hypothetical protein
MMAHLHPPGEGAVSKSHVSLALASILLASCSARAANVHHSAEAAHAQAAAQTPDHRRAYFGELHLHTAYSFDAWSLMGTKTTPDQAYKFARGETVRVGGVDARRGWPLDFAAVTDHSENIGVMNQLDDPKSAFSLSALGRQIAKDPASAFYLLKHAVDQHQSLKDINAKSAMMSAWPPRTATTSPASSRPSSPTSGPRWRRASTTCTAT